MIVFMKSLPPVSCTTTSTGAFALTAIVIFLLCITPTGTLLRPQSVAADDPHALHWPGVLPGCRSAVRRHYEHNAAISGVSHHRRSATLSGPGNGPPRPLVSASSQVRSATLRWPVSQVW